MPKLTNDQINRLSQLGIDTSTGGIPFPPSSSSPPSSPPSSAISKPHLNTSNTPSNISNNNKLPLKSTLTTAKTVDQTVSSSEPNRLLTPQISPTSSKNNIFPLLSISGLTLLSFGGLVFFKTKTSDSAISNQPSTNQTQPAPQSTPTQVPKSIQHYLLASQQYFSSALQQQSSCTGDSCDQPVIELLNQSILTATDAIKLFPSDYRGYQQRAKIYQSLSDSQPQLLTQAISDYTQAQQLNPNSAEITRDLAALYAKTGDAAKTITYLTQTVALEPTKAQNFYDLAKIQQQTGLLPQALETYTRLLSLITDPVQRQQVESEKLALQNLTLQCKSETCTQPQSSPTSLPQNQPLNFDAPTIQALTSDGPIIASTPESKNITVNNQTESNSLSGTSTLPANQSQINIPNTNLTATSQVYLTITKGGKNQTLQVISKTSKSFTVGLDSSIPENIEFKWWIIN